MDHKFSLQPNFYFYRCPIIMSMPDLSENVPTSSQFAASNATASENESNEDDVDDTHSHSDTDRNKPISSINNSSLKLPSDELEIFRAVRFNDLSMIERQIRSGVDINIQHEGEKCYIRDRVLQRAILTKGYTPLHVAVLHSSLEIVKYLIDRGADVNGEECNKQTPLHFATACGREEMVEILLEHGADVNKQTSSGKTVLMVAIVSNHISLVRRLLAAGAQLELVDIKGGTALYMSTIFTGNDGRFTEALIKAGCDVNKKNKQGATALMMAVQLHHFYVVSILLKAGACINQADQAGLTPLHSCVESNHHLDMALYLIQQGADVNLKDRKGKTPFDKALIFGRLRMIKLLISVDADISYTQLTSERMVELSGYWQPFKDWLQKEITTPWSLQRCCRQVIRKTLSPDRMGPGSVDTLCIPTSLKSYLRLKLPELDIEYGLSGPKKMKSPITASMVPIVPFMMNARINFHNNQDVES